MTGLVRRWFSRLFSRPRATSARGGRRPRLELLEVRRALATRIWDGDAVTNDLWTNRFNWKDNIAPVAGDELVFPVVGLLDRSTFNDFSTGTFFRSITFTDDGYTVRGRSILLGQGGIHVTEDSGSADPTVFHINIALTAGSTPINVEAGEIVELKGVISGNSGGLNKVGAGILTLSGSSANTNNGTTQVSAGRMNLVKSAGLNAFNGPLIVGDGGLARDATLLVGQANQIPNSRTVTVNSDGLLDLRAAETIGPHSLARPA